MNRKRGFTLIELLVVMAIIALLIGLLLPALAKARAQAKLLTDGSQVREVHKAWVIFAGQAKGKYPTPGLIQRLPVDVGMGSQHIIGRGEEDVLNNTTGNMLSACVAQNYFTPKILVGTTEVSGNVFIKDDYNYAAYDPIANSFWDGTFSVDLDGEDGSNTSYAHMPISGERKVKHWKDSQDSKWAICSNRGVRNGDDQTEEYKDSITLEMHGGIQQWLGNLCYNDNHIEVSETFWPEGVFFRSDTGGPDNTGPDNVFNNQTGGSQTKGDGYDCWLTITRSIFGTSDNQTLLLEWD